MPRPPSPAMADPLVPARAPPAVLPTPSCPADLRDGIRHLGEVLVPAGNMPPGIVTDAGLWAALGSCMPGWPQWQQQRKQQHHRDTLGPGREKKGQVFTGARVPHCPLTEPQLLSQSPSDVFLLWPRGSCHYPEPPTPPQSRDCIVIPVLHQRKQAQKGDLASPFDCLPSGSVRPCRMQFSGVPRLCRGPRVQGEVCPPRVRLAVERESAVPQTEVASAPRWQGA